VQALAARRPVLGVFEDAHWADPTTIELLDLMVGRAAGLPLLLVVTHRPEFRAPWANQAQVAELRLDRLGPRDSAALVGRVAAAAGAGALPPEVVEGIVERTDGVPLFAEELTRAVLEAGYNGAGAQAVPAVPATLHASLAARLDRLGPAAKRAAQAGAAIGREFDQDLLAAAVDMPDHDLAPALRRLEDAGLVHRRGAPPGATYSFRHALLRDAAYGMLLRGQRRTLHARVAEALEELRPEAAEREPQVLAWHCANAGLTDRAVALWRRAGERSAARYANLEAAEHFRRALEALGELAPGGRRDRLEAELRLAQAVPLIAAHGFGSEAVEAAAVRATELGDRFPGWPGAFIARRLAWNSCLLRREAPRTVALAQDLLTAAEADGDPARVAVAHRALGYSLFVAGEQAEADPVLERGAAVADGVAGAAFAAYGEDPRVVCRIYRGQVRALMGRPEAAMWIAGEGLARARACGNPHAVAWSLVVLAHLDVILRDADGAERAAAEAAEVAGRHGLPQWLALAHQWHGWALCRLGDTARGLALLEEGVRRLRGTGAVLHTTNVQCCLAEGRLLTGEPEAALCHVEAAHRHAEAYGERYFLAEIHRVRAEARRVGGGPAAEREGHLREALAVARGQGARLLELRAAHDLFRLQRDEGRVAEAIGLLAPVYASFTEGFAFPDLVEAKALLEEFGAAPVDGSDRRREEARTRRSPDHPREPAPDR
jgi:predicted ATPase